MSKSVLIGDFLHRIKRPMELYAKKYYKLATIKMNHKGVVLRHEKVGSEIKSKMYEVKTGDFILSGIDARNGAFGIVPKELDGAIVTNDFWYFEIDKNIVDKHLFLELTSTQWFDEICRKGSDGTTQRIRLQKNKFFNQEINLPPIEEQSEFIAWFKQCKQKNNDLSFEISHQQTLLKKLRQRILQEAIEGKLTKDWRADNPDVEPASELLKRIQAEKEQLIKDKKIKKQKPLPPISEEEKPFELPEEWEWSRLVDIFEFIDYRGKTPVKSSTGFRLITAKNIRMGYIDDNPVEFISKELYKTWMVRGFPKRGDLLFVTEGHTMGFVALVDLDFKFTLAQRTIDLQPYIHDYGQWVFYSIMSPFFQEMIKLNATGAAATGIKSARLKTLMMPIPPLAEQKAIVTKVEKLLALCDQLQTQITTNQAHAEQLMQVVLKEAFSQNSGQVAKRVSNA